MAKSKQKPKPASKPKGLSLELDELKKAAVALRAVNHKLRLQILNLIDQKGEIMVSDIYARLRLEQSLTSAFLAKLRNANLVKTRREGQSIYYSVNYDHISQMQEGAKMING
jgi:DNA-binding transcriptional ArsR family regulator